MYTAVRIQEKGQVTIPTNIRRKLNLKKGDLVTFVATENGIVIRPLEEVADELLAGLQKKLDQRGISLDTLMERSVQKGGDAAAAELGVSEAEKKILIHALLLRAQAAVEKIRENAKKNGTAQLTDEEIEAEIQAARREMHDAHRP